MTAKENEKVSDEKVHESSRANRSQINPIFVPSFFVPSCAHSRSSPSRYFHGGAFLPIPPTIASSYLLFPRLPVLLSTWALASYLSV